jgi:hypothetical protein
MEKLPRSRQDGLIVRELEHEILIYDTRNNRAHCLNDTAAKVWKHCDGQTTTEQMSRLLSVDGTPVDEQVIWFALKQFDRDELLEESLSLPPAFIASGLNRRAMVRVLGLAAVVAVPLVTSIVAPSAVQAATCLPPGSGCSTPSQCCSGLCGTPSAGTSGGATCS